MPIYEFRCRSCHHEFEALVRTGGAPACPACQSADLERLVSMFAVDSTDSRRKAVDSARRRHAKTYRDKTQADAEYEKKHLDDH